MSDGPRIGVYASVPNNDRLGASPLCERPGFARMGGERPLSRAAGRQPFRRFDRRPDVDVVAARVDDLILRPGASCATANGVRLRRGYAEPTVCSSASAGRRV